MDLFRSVLGSVTDPGGSSSSTPSSADTIERLVDRLTHSTLLDDRRDACRGLKAMSRKFRVEVGAQALDPMTSILEMDASDEEILSYALETLCNICSPEEFEEEIISEDARDNINNIGEQFTEIYLKLAKNVQLVVDLLEEYDFKVRRPAVKLLTHLLLNKPREMQELILGSHMGVSRLMDVLVDPREVLRNDALLLLIQLTKGNANLQKIVAFENAFDKLVDIVQMEDHSDGGIVVEDCLRLMLNLLRNNPSNQTFFREGSYIQKVAPFFDLTLDAEEIEVGWSAQKVSNMLHMLLVVRTLVSPSNPTNVTSNCQVTILQCGLLQKMCSILMAAGIPADILTETINAISESIRGSKANQEYFSTVTAPSVPPKPALILLLMSMVNEKQPFSLRCAVLYCFQCYLHKNPAGQQETMLTLLPSSATGPRSDKLEVTAGQLLCGGLFSPDKLSNWFSSTALAHGLMDQENIKLELLRVQLSTAGGNQPVSFLVQCCNIVQMTNNSQSRIGLLMLISTWVNSCTTAVAHLLSVESIVPFLTGQIGSNEHDELERLGQGLCAFVLGLAVVNNDDSVAGSTQDQLFQLIEKLIGLEVFIDKLSEVSKHEAYNRALKHPQLKCHDSKDLVFDHKFCSQFKFLEHEVINWLNKRKENSDDATAVTNGQDVAQYKEMIREQDTRINDLTQANIFLQQALSAAKHQVEELQNSIQTLKDQNQLLKASSKHGAAIVSNGHESNSATPPPTATQQAELSEAAEKLQQSEEARKKLERELQIRDDIIHELEMRSSSTEATTAPATASVPPTAQQQIEVQMLQSQMKALHATLATKEADVDRLQGHLDMFRSMKGEFEGLRSEQDDLLMMLSDQDTKISDYRKRLRALGQTLEDEEGNGE